MTTVAKIEQRIYIIRGQRVMLSSDLARLYDVTPGALIQAVKRNPGRFPADFMFQLTREEVASLKSRSVISSEHEPLRSQIVILDKGRGRHLKYRPYAFTEQGVAMLSSVLRSERAVQVNIEIMRAFIRLKQWSLSVTDLTSRMDALEAKYDRQFKVVFDAIRHLMEPPIPPQKRIGFQAVKG